MVRCELLRFGVSEHFESGSPEDRETTTRTMGPPLGKAHRWLQPEGRITTYKLRPVSMIEEWRPETLLKSAHMVPQAFLLQRADAGRNATTWYMMFMAGGRNQMGMETMTEAEERMITCSS